MGMTQREWNGILDRIINRLEYYDRIENEWVELDKPAPSVKEEMKSYKKRQEAFELVAKHINSLWY